MEHHRKNRCFSHIKPEPFEVEKIVLGVEKKEEVEGALKALESKGVKAKSVLAYNLSNLSNLA